MNYKNVIISFWYKEMLESPATKVVDLEPYILKDEYCTIDLSELEPYRFTDYPYCWVMEDIDKEFVSRVKKGDIMVGGKNFGCGSSREHAPIAIKKAGISVVIAETFARIFYRNAINIGLAILECESASKNICAGDSVEVDFDTGLIVNHTKGETYKAQPFPPFIQDIISKGGLLSSISQK